METRIARRKAGHIAVCAVLFIVTALGNSFAVSPSEVDNALERAKDFHGKIDTNNSFMDQMKSEAEKTYKKFDKDIRPQIRKWQDKMGYKNGRIIFDADKKKQNKGKRPELKSLLASDERIYIFISSSIPQATLKTYAAAAGKLKDPRIIMVLRGCIGGCEKFMPTAGFVQSILSPSDGDKYTVELQIDPYLFRLYQVEAVPAIVFASNVHAPDETSEGLEGNLKASPMSHKIQGDVSLQYAVENINRKLNNPRLTALLKQMGSGWLSQGK